MTVAFRALPHGPAPICRHPECRDRPRGARLAFWLVVAPGVQPRAMCAAHCAAEAAAAGAPFPPTKPVE